MRLYIHYDNVTLLWEYYATSSLIYVTKTFFLIDGHRGARSYLAWTHHTMYSNMIQCSL